MTWLSQDVVSPETLDAVAAARQDLQVMLDADYINLAFVLATERRLTNAIARCDHLTICSICHEVHALFQRSWKNSRPSPFDRRD